MHKRDTLQNNTFTDLVAQPIESDFNFDLKMLIMLIKRKKRLNENRKWSNR